ncbi:MAG TPA: restriction endonuclease subunit S [Chloroflexi bacterium]|nr:restriction endonuclease subunit S [Chloroflexota bacterium]
MTDSGECDGLSRSWNTVRLGDVAVVHYGRARPSSDNGPVPVVGSGGIYAWTSHAYFDRPTLVIGRKGTAGRAWLIEMPSWPSDTAFYLGLSGAVDLRYVYYCLCHTPLSGEHARTTLPSLSRSDVEEYTFSCPPLPEQRAIAHVLDTVQRAREATERVIAATRELKRSLMRHLFTYGPVPIHEADKVPLKETEIGMVPEEWEVLPLGELVSVHDKKRIPVSAEKRSRMRGPYPYCGANGIVDFVDDFLFEGEYVLLAEDGGRWGGYEESAYVMKGRFWVNNHAHIIQALEGVTLNAYVVQVLNYMDISRYISGTTRGKLNQGVMKSLPLPVLPLDVQQAVAHALRTVDEKLEAEKNRKQALEALFQSLLHNLMTGKLRVNVDSMEVAE